jgi:serine acetyltransferase
LLLSTSVSLQLCWCRKLFNWLQHWRLQRWLQHRLQRWLQPSNTLAEAGPFCGDEQTS